MTPGHDIDRAADRRGGRKSIPRSSRLRARCAYLGAKMTSRPRSRARVRAALTELRERAGLTQEDLGRRLGCHQTLISHMERGCKPVTPTMAVKLLELARQHALGRLADVFFAAALAPHPAFAAGLAAELSSAVLAALPAVESLSRAVGPNNADLEQIGEVLNRIWHMSRLLDPSFLEKPGGDPV